VNILRVWSNFVRVIYTLFDVWKQAIVSLTIYNVQDRHYTQELRLRDKWHFRMQCSESYDYKLKR